MIEYIPIIVTAMIAYDLSIHLVYLFGFDKKIISRKMNWWPNFDRKEKRIYQIFWNIFWSVAFVLMLIYILN